ncbi:MAG: ribosomal protein S18-alanine N-acetyltransferase [Candidatus Thorarchaeota archaeon]
MLQEYRIRSFDRDDIGAVVKINRSCLPENYPDQFFLGLYHHAPKAFLVAECDEGICGYIMCRIERGISSFGRSPVKKGHIVSIAVKTEHRHQGVGSELVKAAMKGMSEYGVSEYFLEVRKTNKAAISIYQKLDYEIKRVLKGYYRDGEDAYLMVLEASKPEEVDSTGT